MEPHSHPQFGQIVFVRSGGGLMTIEPERRPFASPGMPIDPAHGFEYGMDSDGWVPVSILRRGQAGIRTLEQKKSSPVPARQAIQSGDSCICLPNTRPVSLRGIPASGTEFCAETSARLTAAAVPLMQPQPAPDDLFHDFVAARKA